MAKAKGDYSGFHSEYKGINIWRAARYDALRWEARAESGDMLRADTLAGIKALIRDSIEVESN